MADIRGMGQNQALIRAECDQKAQEAWKMLYEQGEDWTDRLDQMISAFADHDEQPWKAMGLLAQIGFLHILESYSP